MNKLGIFWPQGVERVLVAVSGGADSMALLALLRDAARDGGKEIFAAHFEHGIRGEMSLEDAAFVRGVCAEWGVPLLEGSADVPALAREKRVGLEQAARDARYAFLREARNRVGADLIALAHHRDDQAETVLMHLLRGSGLNGVSGMREREGDLYRPLLEFDKKELVDFLREKGVSWREDATNAQADTPRNALRLDVLPEMERVYPGAKRALARFARIAAREEDYLRSEAGRMLDERSARWSGGSLLCLSGNEHPAMLARMLRVLCPVDGESTEALLGLCAQSAGAMSLPGGWTAWRGQLGLYLLKADWEAPGETPLRLPGVTEFGELGCVRAEKGRGEIVRDDPFCQELDAGALRGAVLRTRRPGDYIHPLGAPGRQKLSDYFINRRVDKPLRDMTALIARGREIFWVAGQGISENAKATPGSDTVRLKMTGWPIQKLGGNTNA